MFLPGESQGWGSLVGIRLWGTQSQTRLKWLSSSSDHQCWTSFYVPVVHLHVFFEKSLFRRDTRWRRSRWKWSTSIFTEASGMYLQIQRISQRTSWVLTGVPDHQTGIYSSTQNSLGWRKEEKKRVSRTWPAPGSGGGEARVGSQAVCWDRREAFEAMRVTGVTE